MFLQEAPADTFDYMVLGFVVILGPMALYIWSLFNRRRNLIIMMIIRMTNQRMMKRIILMITKKNHCFFGASDLTHQGLYSVAVHHLIVFLADNLPLN